MKKNAKRTLLQGKRVKRVIAIATSIVIVTANGVPGNPWSCFGINDMKVEAATKKPTAIKLNITKKTLYEGKTVTLKVKKVTPAKASASVSWKTSNKKVANVTSKGKVTAKKAGTAKITAISKKNKKVKAVCSITVKKKKVAATATPAPTPTATSPVPSVAPSNTSGTAVTTAAPADTTGPTVIETTSPMVTVTAPPIEGDIIYSGACGNTTWTINKDGLLEVKGTGDMYDSTYKNEVGNAMPAWCSIEYKDEIKSARIEVTGATNLKYLFYNCKNLASVELGRLDTSNVTDMSDMFSYCSSLANLDLSSFDTLNVTNMSNMFGACSSLTKLDLSNFNTSNVTGMWGMFCGCSNLSNLDLGSFNTLNVTSMWGMFSGCRNLTNLNLESFNTSNVADMFNMFFDCNSLTTIKTPQKSSDTVSDLPESVWEDNNGQKYTTLPANATESITLTRQIPTDGPIQSNLPMATIIPSIEPGTEVTPTPVVTETPAPLEGPKILTEEDLTYDVLENGTIEIKGYKSKGKYAEIILPDTLEGKTVTSIKYSVFLGCKELKSIKIPSGIKTIKSHAFENCTGLEQIELPEELSAIEYGVFEGCSSLQDIQIPESVNRIEQGAFVNCSSLKKITIPSKIEYMMWYETFKGCSSLENITIPEENKSFASVDGVVLRKNKEELIYVPKGKQGDYIVPETVKYISGEYGLNGVFADCAKLTSVTISKNVISVGANMNAGNEFTGCENLTAIYVSEGNRVYSSMDGVLVQNYRETSSVNGEPAQTMYRCILLRFPTGRQGEYVVPDNVAEIADSAFNGCNGLTKVTLPETCTTIGEGVFRNCDKLMAVDMKGDKGNYYTVDGVLFGKKYVSDDPYNPMGDYHERTVLINVPAGKEGTYNIPEGVEIIGGYAFSGCSKLTGVVIPDSVIQIGGDAFLDCSSLTNINLPDEVKTIDIGAFSGCHGLIEVAIPDSVTTMGNGVFSDCDSLKKVRISNSVTKIGEYLFSNCSSLTEVTIPAGVTNIGQGAFSCCTSLTSVVLPEGVTRIEGYAFGSCTNLTSITIPASVTNMGVSEEYPEFGEQSPFLGIEKKITIYTTAGSYAEQYAINNNIKVVTQ